MGYVHWQPSTNGKNFWLSCLLLMQPAQTYLSHCFRYTDFNFNNRCDKAGNTEFSFAIDIQERHDFDLTSV